MKPFALVSLGLSLLATPHAVLAAPRFIAQPTVVANPNATVPLAGILKFQASEPVSASVAVDDGDKRWKIEFPKVSEGPAELALVGFRAGRQVSFALTIRNAKGETSTSTVPLNLRTPALPEVGLAWPGMKVSRDESLRAEGGVRFLSVRRRAPGRQSYQTPAMQRFSRKWGLVLGLDAAGEVVWLYRSPNRVAGIQPLDNGNLLFTTEDQRTTEIDLLGNVKGAWYAENRPDGPMAGAIPLKGIKALHHEPAALPWGNFIQMAGVARPIDNYYTSVTDADAPRKRAMVMGDRIVEFDRSGKVVWEWDAFDHLDPFRIHYHLFQPYWFVRGYPDHLDWTHGNGIDYDAKTGTILMSLKHQDAIIAIDRKTSAIKWILGEPTGWPPHLARKVLKGRGLLRYPYSPHHPHLTPQGTLVYYDNGMFQARPFTGAAIVPFERTFSRAVEVRIDQKAMTATEVWTSDRLLTPDSCNNWAMGEAQRLPATGNMLVIRAFCPPLDPNLQHSDESRTDKRYVDDVVYGARMEEYTRDDTARLISRVSFDDPNGVIQWQIYGGFHVPSLYWKQPNGPHN